MHKQIPHEGEVSWHQYSQSLNKILVSCTLVVLLILFVVCYCCCSKCLFIVLQPHSWLRNSDTHFRLAHFKKDRKKSEEPDVTDHIMKGVCVVFSPCTPHVLSLALAVVIQWNPVIQTPLGHERVP